MAEKKSGLHKNIASIFQDLAGRDKEQQKKPENTESKQTEDVITDLLTPSHLVSETDTAQQLEYETDQQDDEQQGQITEEQSEQPVEGADTIHKEPETSEDQKTEPGTDEETRIVSETTIQQKLVDHDETPAPEIVKPKVIAPKPAAQLTGIRKIVKNIQDKLLAPKPGVDPKRQKLTLVVIPLLVVVLIVVLPQVLKKPARNINKTKQTDTPVVLKTSKDINWQIPELYPESLRDPMKAGTVSTTKAVTGDIVVKGILFSLDNPSALIAEEIVHEGDQVLGATIIKINKDNVQFERDGQTWTQSVQR